jgi:hypothetical protein
MYNVHNVHSCTLDEGIYLEICLNGNRSLKNLFVETWNYPGGVMDSKMKE